MRPEPPAIHSRAELQRFVDDCAGRTDGRLGVFLGFPEADGSLDVVAARNPETAFASASVIKLPVLYALYARHQDDLTALGEPHGIAQRNRVGGSGLFHLLDDLDPSLRDLARAMVAISDNAATNELIDHLGLDAVNERAAALGMEQTRLRRRMMVTLEDTDLEPERDPPADEPANTTSPEDCARLFADLVGERSLSPAAYEEMRVPLREQKDPSHFPRYFPYDAHVEHKTGWIPTAALDAGLLVTGRASADRPLLFATFVDRVGHGADGGDLLAELGDGVRHWLLAD